MKKIRTFIALLLCVLMAFPSNLLASSSGTEEVVIWESVSSGIEIVVTETPLPNGTYSYKEYWDGQLKENHNTGPGSGTILHQTYESDGSISQSIEIVGGGNTGSLIQPQGFQTRDLGYMHYSGTLYTISIFCHLEENYTEGDTYVINKNLAKSASWWISELVSRLGFIGKIASNVLEEFILEEIFSDAIEGVVTALITTTVTANVYDQTIVGNCTSHSGRPTGRLTGQVAYVHTSSTGTKIYREGYTTSLWGTGELGRQMFWKVWGTEYTPTSWTGV